MPKPVNLGRVVADHRAKRDRIATFRLNDAEWQRAYARMRELGFTNFSAYVRALACDGYVPVVREYVPSRRLVYEINRIGVNINQIARKVNTDRTVDFLQLEDLIALMKEVRSLILAEHYGHGIREN